MLSVTFKQRILDNLNFLVHGTFIYTNEIVCICDKHLSEFSYKALNKVLCCNLFITKCTIRVNAKCDHCDADMRCAMLLFYEYGCKNVSVEKLEHLQKSLYFETCRTKVLRGIKFVKKLMRNQIPKLLSLFAPINSIVFMGSGQL